MSKLNDRSIKKRLSSSNVMILCVTSVAAILGVVAMLIMTNRYNNALTNYGFSQGDIGKAMVTFAETRSDLRAAIGYDDEDVIAAVVDDYEAKKQACQDYMTEVKQYMVTKEGMEAYNKIVSDLDNYWPLSDELITTGAVSDRTISEQVQRRALDELKPQYESVYADMKDLLNVNVEKGKDTERALMILEIVFTIAIIFIIAVALMISRKIGSSIANGILTPIQALENRLKTFAQGDMDSPFPVADSGDEVAEMVEEARNMAENQSLVITDLSNLLMEMANGNFTAATQVEDRYVGKFADLLAAARKMRVQIGDALQQVEVSSQQVSAGSDNLAHAAQDMAEGATEQAGAVEELQATITDITAGVERTAADLKVAYEDAQKYRNDADASRIQMATTVEAMNRISETSEKIKNIIADLEEIASQTNLLSLNASIEAARAGEAGRGFAVVADQIRTLAEQSSQSAVSTRDLIESALYEVEEGNKAVAAVSKTLDEVVDGMGAIADKSKSLSEQSETQASTMEQIESGVNQISDVVQSNSSVAEEISATSEELSAQAETLNALVERFKL